MRRILYTEKEIMIALTLLLNGKNNFFKMKSYKCKKEETL